VFETPVLDQKQNEKTIKRIKDLDKLDLPNLVKLAYDGLVLGPNQFLILPQQPQKTMLASKVVKIDSRIINLLCKSYLLKHLVFYISVKILIVFAIIFLFFTQICRYFLSHVKLIKSRSLVEP